MKQLENTLIVQKVLDNHAKPQTRSLVFDGWPESKPVPSFRGFTRNSQDHLADNLTGVGLDFDSANFRHQEGATGCYRNRPASQPE